MIRCTMWKTQRPSRRRVATFEGWRDAILYSLLALLFPFLYFHSVYYFHVLDCHPLKPVDEQTLLAFSRASFPFRYYCTVQ